MESRKFSDVLSNAAHLDWRTALYLPKNKKLWGLDCQAIIENPDHFEAYGIDDNPVEISNISYRYVLICDDLSSIVKSLQEQDASYDLSMAYKAFMYYIENDSFMKLAL